MPIAISKLHHDHISPTDPDDISALTTELSGKPITLSHEDVVDIAKRTTTIVARSPQDGNHIVGLGCVVSMRLPQGYRHLIESMVVLPALSPSRYRQKNY